MLNIERIRRGASNSRKYNMSTNATLSEEVLGGVELCIREYDGVGKEISKGIDLFETGILMWTALVPPGYIDTLRPMGHTLVSSVTWLLYNRLRVLY